MRRRILHVLWFAMTLSACDNTPMCLPKTHESCYCATGDIGQRQCAADGESYATCSCLPDAGVPDASAAEGPAPTQRR